MYKVRVYALCSMVMIFAAASAHAAPSCCEPGGANQSVQAPQAMPAPQMKAQKAVPRTQPVVASMAGGRNVPQNQRYAASPRPVNAPAAPSCCSGATGPAPQQVQRPVAGCGCCAGRTGCQGPQSGLMQGQVGPVPYVPASYGYPAANPAVMGASVRPVGSLW